MSTANQGQLLFSSAALGRCACVSTSYTLCARTRAYVHVWVGTCKYAWGQASTPRCSFNTEGTFPGDASEDRNLADERPSLCLLCCFTTPWLQTSAKQPQRPFVILMVTGGTLQLLTRTQSSDCAPRSAFKDRETCGDAGKITGWRQPLKPQHLNAYKMSLQGHRTTLQTGFWLATASDNL